MPLLLKIILAWLTIIHCERNELMTDSIQTLDQLLQISRLKCNLRKRQFLEVIEVSQVCYSLNIFYSHL